MNRFSKLHPILHLFFYLFSLMFVLVVSNPFYSLVSLICAFLYNAVIAHKRTLKSLSFVFFIIIFVSLFNMLFAHYGNDVLFRIGYTDFTLEALFYGFNQGMVFAAVVMWFSALSFNSDGDRVLYLFSFAPKLSLMFSMILGFIPRFNQKLTEIRDAQKALRGGESPRSIKDKFKNAINNLSALITYSLESSIITADSMNARGYKRGALSVKRYKLCAEDIIFFAVIVLSAIYLIYSKAVGNISFIFEPVIYSKSFSISAFIVFIIAELIPFVAEIWEEMLWKLSNSKA
ncbi:MAG: energy-coupling factor transporter transmembrane protein EcfT [Eubacterium sp.]|nr:energy-coupling factor transporter transmembrane protein EcfT [Eubacterium sp.]